MWLFIKREKYKQVNFKSCKLKKLGAKLSFIDTAGATPVFRITVVMKSSPSVA
jgi:hypothetical protein